MGNLTGSSNSSSNLSPGVSSYLRQNLSSTPVSKGKIENSYFSRPPFSPPCKAIPGTYIELYLIGLNGRFDPRTFTRSHQKYSDNSFSSPMGVKPPNYSSNSSNQLLQLNISDISLVECSPQTVDIGKTRSSFINKFRVGFHLQVLNAQ